MSIKITINNEEEVIVALLKHQLINLVDDMARHRLAEPDYYALNKKDWRRLRKALIRVINYNAPPSEQLEE